jgi:DNA-binding CsgD family transcriptional regulator
MLQAAFGAWLRRQRRIAESRRFTRSALLTFDLIGARGWAARARSELAAAGERQQAFPPSLSGVLSPQQQEIAQLAARGLSNREIGEQLFLSPRTVGSHLYRMFPKLGVTSRIQLADRVRDLGSETSLPRPGERDQWAARSSRA